MALNLSALKNLKTPSPLKGIFGKRLFMPDVPEEPLNFRIGEIGTGISNKPITIGGKEVPTGILKIPPKKSPLELFRELPPIKLARKFFPSIPTKEEISEQAELQAEQMGKSREEVMTIGKTLREKGFSFTGKELTDIGLNPEEVKTIYSPIIENIVLNSTVGFLGMSKNVGNIIPKGKIVQTIGQEIQPFVKNIRNIPKNKFVEIFKGALSSKDIAIATKAKNALSQMEKAGLTIEKFYDTTTQSIVKPQMDTSALKIPAKKAEARKFILDSEKPVKQISGLEDKIGIVNKGFDFNIFGIKPEILGTIGKGEITDAFISIKDKKIAQSILDEYIAKQNAITKRVAIKQGLLEKDIKLLIEKERNQIIEKTKNIKDAPATEKIYSKEISPEIANIQGYGKAGYGSGQLPTIYLSDNKNQAVISADKYAFVKKYLPEAELRIGKDAVSPVQITVGKELKGLIMPIKMDKPFPFKVGDFPALTAQAPKKSLPQKEAAVKPKIRQIKTSAEISSLEKMTQETREVKDIADEIIKMDKTGTVKDVAVSPQEPDLITTRKFKQTDEWKEFAKYAEENLQDKDIHPAILFRHSSLTAERVAEFLDGKLGGKTYEKIIKPVYDGAKKMMIEGSKTKNEVHNFGILEGSGIDRDASLFAQKKISEASPKAKNIADYIRAKYEEYLVRLNKERAKLGIEPIPKRQDYITHINELNTLSELFGGLERVSVKKHISILKSRLLDEHPDWTEARAFDAAKRQVEGLTGISQYVDARQPVFKFAKQRLVEYETNPSIIRSFNAYMSSALRYIYQAENVARNKAFKDVLPANAKEFIRLWNTEQVAGRQAPSIISPIGRKVLSAIRGTIGANTILGNLATTMMQLTSYAQVFALAGVRNTFFGIGKRLRSYISGQHTLFEQSRTRVLRNLDIDIGLGDSLIDQLLIFIGKRNALRDPAAITRQAIDFGRKILRGIMEIADQFTVGASYEAFYRKAILDGVEPNQAMEYAEIMTGKTQANYFKEALPPFLNTTEGRTVGQFGTYTMNQWEMFKKDFGKDFKLDEKSPRSVKNFFKQFIVFLTAAYVIDSISEKTFGRQPYNIKSLINDSIGFAKGELTGGQLFNTSTETVASYTPFMGSVKYKTMPPVLDFGKDVINAIFGSETSQQNSINNFKEKWIYNILLPYGGTQVKKTLQGVEAITEIDFPFVRNTSKDINIETNVDKARAFLFNPYATEEAIKYFENRERRDTIKSKFNITGTITSDENIVKLKKMSDEEFKIYTDQYAESTIITVNKKMGKEIGVGKKPLNEIFNKTGKKSLEYIFK